MRLNELADDYYYHYYYYYFSLLFLRSRSTGSANEENQTDKREVCGLFRLYEQAKAVALARLFIVANLRSSRDGL